MELIRAFCGLRPGRELAARVAGPPYDVVDRGEACALAEGNPYSFLRINKPEVNLPAEVDAYHPSVYASGAMKLREFIEQGWLQQDSAAHYYVYKQVMGKHEQAGLVAAASVDAYEQGLIKKHEHTRPDKETDRVQHMDALGAQVGPVFLTYRANPAIDALIDKAMQSTPEYDFTADDGIRHIFWVISDPNLAAQIDSRFTQVPCLYVADGHHRSAAAARVRALRQKRNLLHKGSEPYNYFLAVLFPHNQMQILDYNRIVLDLNGHSPEGFIDLLAEHFNVKPCSQKDAHPARNQFGLYLQNQWHLLKPKQALLDTIDPTNPVASLDVSLLQETIFTPLLNIKDQRTDKRVDFVGGIRGYEELEKRVTQGPHQAAFTLHPTTVEDLMAVADANKVMPPKSTWFEPKLRSGLIIHPLS